jgi:hypothetical protein
MIEPIIRDPIKQRPLYSKHECLDVKLLQKCFQLSFKKYISYISYAHPSARGHYFARQGMLECPHGLFKE